jgi:hypothetical protein
VTDVPVVERGSALKMPMQLTSFTPGGVLWAWLPGDGSDVSTLHKGYARGMWCKRNAFQRARLFLHALLLWPLVTLVLSTACTAVNGRTTRRRFGKPVLRQAAEQLHLAVRHGIAPPWYYIFGLWDDGRRAKAALYLHRYETKRALYRLLRHHRDASGGVLTNKLRFREWCVEHGLPTPAPVLSLQDGAVEGGDGRLPPADLFVKPRKSKGGRGCERWDWVGNGRYRSHRGEEREEAELVALLAERSREQPLVVQRRLVNHPDLLDLTTGALATARLMTVLNEKGGFEVGCAVFRTPAEPDATVDNFHAGGLVCGIDLATGELGQARGGGSRGFPRVATMVLCEVHPVTGARITGRRLPGWREAKELALRAHAAVPRLAVVGWDVAITSDGPVLVEGNSAPDVDLMQVGHGAPLGETRVVAALAHQVRRALPAAARP